MKVKLAYGKNGLIVDLPSKDIDIIEPSFVEGINILFVILASSLDKEFDEAR